MAQISVSFAAKAYPFPMTFTQSDGTQITVRLHGDEDFHWYTDMQGNILERSGNDFTPIDVDADTYISAGLAKRKTVAMRREPITWTASLFPHTGSPKALVILVEYSDNSFSMVDAKASFDQYLNKTDGSPENLGNQEHRNYGSVRQYFEEASYGTYSPQFDVVGPVKLSNSMEYYGGTNDSGSDEKYRQLVADACEAVNDSVDFSEYDADGNGYADLVYIIYAGYGQSFGGDNNTIWPKSFSYGSSSTKYDGVGLSRCGVSNELLLPDAGTRITGIGLFVHEFSHCLGLPDLYYSNAPDNQGMENWSVMDNGEYNNYGYYPTMYTAWEREAMGWDSIPTITTAGQYGLVPEQGKRAVKIVNPNNSNDYFVLEHFETTGFNSRIAWASSYNPTLEGLLIYHVNYSSSYFSLGSYPNSVFGSPRMTTIPADGRLLTSYDTSITALEYAQEIAGDIFCNDTTFTQSGGLPNAAWWYTADDQPLYNINYNEGAVWFDYLEQVATTGINAVALGKDEGKVYTLDGRYMGTSTAGLPAGLYIVGGKKIVVGY